MHRGEGAPVVRLRWVYTDQPFLPLGTNSVINNRVWNDDQESDLEVGQLPLVESNYRQDARWKLPAFAFNGHQCNPQWFSTGEPWPVPATLPPTVSLAGWIPECCVMACDFEDCSRTPVNDEPASQQRQYPIPAVEAVPSTPFVQRQVAVAQQTGGGSWPAVVTEWWPSGAAGAAQFVVTDLTRPDGTPYSRTEQFVVGGGDTLTRTMNASGYTFAADIGGVAFAMTLSVFMGQGRISGTNLTIDPAILPPYAQPRRTSALVATGGTQADAAPIVTTNTQAVALAITEGIRLPVAEVLVTPTEYTGEIYAVVHVNASPVASLQLYPAAGESIEALGVDNPLTVARGTGYLLVAKSGQNGNWAAIPYPQPPGGTVTSVGISTTSAGVTVGGGPVVGAGTLTVDLDADLNALAALAGTNTIYYRSAASTWTAVTIGSFLAFAGGVLDVVPPTATSGETVCAAFTITGATGVYQATGNTIALPAAGTYLVTGRVVGYLQPGAAGYHTIQCRMRNTTAGADLANSEIVCAGENVNGSFAAGTAGFTAIVTVAGATTLELYAARTGTVWTISNITSDANGRSVLDWVRLF